MNIILFKRFIFLGIVVGVFCASIFFSFVLPVHAQGGTIPPPVAGTLYVNGTIGNDAVSRANNSVSNPWRTL